MGVLIPSDFPADHSSAEFRIFRRLRDETPNDWCALHSVGLARHERKPWAEADFVVISDRLVLCLEVKGGRISVRGGNWYTNDKRLSHSPFEQAGGAAGSLKGYLRETLGEDAPVVGWGVMFPYCRFDVVAPYNEPELLYDEADVGTPMHVFVDRLADYWLRRSGGGDRQGLDAARVRALTEVLAPEFSLQPTLSARVKGLADDFVRLTEEQVEVLEGFETQDRLLVQGGAGSGKTLLAMAEADRLAGGGRKVLLGCASSPLAGQLQAAMRPVERVEVAGILTLASSLVARAGLAGEIPEVRDRDVLSIYLPELARKAFLESGADPYGAIVVDEAQDLIQGNWLELLDALLAGGLDAGVWRFFHDPNQDLLLGSEVASLERLEQRAESRYRLTKNCRNTRQIATSTAIFSGLGSIDRCAVDGPDVEQHFYRDRPEERVRAASVVRDWISSGVEPDQIVVLAPRPLAKTAFAGIDEAELGAGVGEGDPEAGRVRFATVEDFKGLESDAILILGVDELEPGAPRLALYVAMTRAQSLLCVMVDAAAEPLFQDLLEDFNERLRAGSLLRR